MATATTGSSILLHQFCEGVVVTLGTVRSDFNKISDLATQEDAGTVLLAADETQKCVHEIDTRTMGVVSRLA